MTRRGAARRDFEEVLQEVMAEIDATLGVQSEDTKAARARIVEFLRGGESKGDA